MKIKKLTSKLSKKVWIAVAVLVFLVTASLLAIFAFGRAQSNCQKIYQTQKDNYDHASSQSELETIFNELQPHESKCTKDKGDLNSSIRFAYLMMASAYLSGNAEQSISIAKSNYEWLAKNTNKETDINPVFIEYEGIVSLSDGNLPTSITEKHIEQK